MNAIRVAHSWFNSYAPELVPMFYYRDKTQVYMFYFLNEYGHIRLNHIR